MIGQEAGKGMRDVVGALLLLTWSFVATAQGQPATLTLACKGTTSGPLMPDEKPQSISMGIIVNFSARTVQGFGYPGLIHYPVAITAANDVTIAFNGHEQFGSTSLHTISGSIDRVTGDVEATSSLIDPKTNKFISQTAYALQCRPTQRMF
jgi:hypothetical protein